MSYHDNDDLDARDKKVGVETGADYTASYTAMTPGESRPSLDALAEQVKDAARRESLASDEFNVLKRLAIEAEKRYYASQHARQAAERILRDAYGEATRP